MTSKSLLKRIIALLASALLIMGLTACGGGNDNVEEESSDDVSVIEEEQSTDEQQLDVQEEAGPKSVDAIDMQVSWKASDTFFDEEEGYDREYTSTSNQAIQFVDYKIFKTNKSDSNLSVLVLHFKRTMDNQFKDKDGNDIEGMGLDFGAFELSYPRHYTKNIDTGETEELDDIYNDDIKPAQFDGMIDWVKETGAWDKLYSVSGDERSVSISDTFIPDMYTTDYESDDISGESGIYEGIGKTTLDWYYIYMFTYDKGWFEISCKNIDADNDDLEITSINDTEQVMTIDLE